MHLHKILLSIIVLLAACKSTSSLPKNYDYTPVLLHLSSVKQADSIGFNLVKELPQLLYPKLLTGDLPLWENSNKEVQITKNSFAEKEKQAISPFVGSNDLFIHEVWKIFKSNFEFGVLGFSFAGKTKFGEKINYGFIDAADIINLLKTTNIPCNANGSSTLSFWNALQSKQFHFNVVQFGKEDFKTNRTLAFELRDQAIKSDKIYREFYKIELDKEIEYKILHPNINSNEENANLYFTVQKLVNSNKQTILNAGGDEYFTHLMFVPWKIENIIVKERWTKYNNIPFQELLTVQLFIDKHSITLNKRQLEELNLKMNLQGIEEYLSEKSFSFILQRINSQEIAPQEADKYYKALRNNNWNKIKS